MYTERQANLTLISPTHLLSKQGNNVAVQVLVWADFRQVQLVFQT